MAKKPSTPASREGTKFGSSRGSTGARESTGSKVLEHLHAEDAKRLLRELAERHPELVREVEQIAAEHASRHDFDEIADQVIDAISELTIFDLTRLSSAHPLEDQPDVEAARDALQHTLRPFVDRIHRHAKMGFVEPALTHCEGVLLGLFYSDLEQVSEILEWMPDGLGEATVAPLKALSPVRERKLPSSGVVVSKALERFAAEHLPGWTWLHGA